MQQGDMSEVFYFRAVTPEGAIFAGQLEARSQDEVWQKLRSAGYAPLNIKDKPIKQSILHREITLGNAKRMSVEECERFCRELSILLNSKLEMFQSLEVMEKAAANGSKLRRFCVGGEEQI